MSFWVSWQFDFLIFLSFFVDKGFFWKEKQVFEWKKFFCQKRFWWKKFFGHYCHCCHYYHYCHYCHYCHYYDMGWKEGRFKLPFDSLKVTFSQSCPTDRPTDRPTNRQTTRLWAAKNMKKGHVTCEMWHVTCNTGNVTWHVTYEMWHVTRDIWHVICGTWRRWTFSQNCEGVLKI